MDHHDLNALLKLGDKIIKSIGELTNEVKKARILMQVELVTTAAVDQEGAKRMKDLLEKLMG